MLQATVISSSIYISLKMTTSVDSIVIKTWEIKYTSTESSHFHPYMLSNNTIITMKLFMGKQLELLGINVEHTKVSDIRGI